MTISSSMYIKQEAWSTLLHSKPSVLTSSGLGGVSSRRSLPGGSLRYSTSAITSSFEGLQDTSRLLRTQGATRWLSPVSFAAGKVVARADAVADGETAPPPPAPCSSSWALGLPTAAPWPVHAVLTIVPAAITATFFNGKLFGYHPTFMALGYLLLMGEGIVATAYAKGKQHRPLLNTHLVMQATASALAGLGLRVIYLQKIALNRPHFTTPHAKLGLVALIATLLVAIGGLPIFFGVPELLKKRKGLLHKGHKLAGKVAFGAGVLACVSGLQVFYPKSPLHKGALTYVLALGVLAAGASALSVTSLGVAVANKVSGWFSKAPKEATD